MSPQETPTSYATSPVLRAPAAALRERREPRAPPRAFLAPRLSRALSQLLPTLPGCDMNTLDAFKLLAPAPHDGDCAWAMALSLPAAASPLPSRPASPRRSTRGVRRVRRAGCAQTSVAYLNKQAGACTENASMSVAHKDHTGLVALKSSIHAILVNRVYRRDSSMPLASHSGASLHTVPPSNLERISTRNSLARALARAQRTHVWIMVPSCWNPARSASSPGQTVLPTCVRVQAKARYAEERKSDRKNTITVAILDEPPAAAPRVWHLIQMGVKHVYHARDEDWPLRARRLRQLHARSAYVQRMTQAPRTRPSSSDCAHDQGWARSRARGRGRAQALAATARHACV
jgi:hypothetical protein